MGREIQERYKGKFIDTEGRRGDECRLPGGCGFSTLGRAMD